MCGICGRFNFGSGKPVDEKRLREMNDTLRHRGPNDEGYYLENDMGLAMRRLSIIDLSGGKQPIHNEDGSLWTVFNGEIFNYRELKSFLEKKGHCFYTSSDTETIVHLYEEYGDDFVHHLRGMFAIALWDRAKRTLLIVRDRVGIKPLFYGVVKDEEIVFGSEPKALLLNPDIDRDMALQGLDAFFAYGYIPAPLSIYKGIRKLPAGHLMKISQAGVTIRKYWDLYFCPDYGKSESYFVEKFEEIFTQAVKMRLLSEVPLGAFLSGGVDSSLVVAYMAKAMKEPPHTFTVGFSGDTSGQLDERPYARMVADRYACEHKEVQVTPKVDEILDDIVTAFDEPFADDSVIPSYYICKVSKESVTVALTGLGGDELFAGYERYLGLRLSLLYDSVPSSLSRLVIAPIIQSLPEPRNGHYSVNHMKRFIRAARLPVAQRYASYVTILDPETRARLYSRDIAKTIDFEATTALMTDHYNSGGSAVDPLDKMFYQDIKTYLPEDILALTDRIGMLHSQELRVPFTDHILVEMCATIPAQMKIRNLRKKYLLKKIARDKLPREVITHRKQGFSSPMAQWLKTDLAPLYKKLLSSERLDKGGILNRHFLEKMICDHVNRIKLNDKLIFSAIMFQKWWEINRSESRDI